MVEVKETQREYPPLQEIVKKRPSVIVELDPPKKLDTTKFFEGVKALKATGIDAITMADNSLASPRISNSALGYLAKTKVNMRPLVHLTCRDRNIIGLQSHLMGLHTLGLNDLLAITGDPARLEISLVHPPFMMYHRLNLIQMIKQLNEGQSYSGKDLGQKTNFSQLLPHLIQMLDKLIKQLKDLRKKSNMVQIILLLSLYIQKKRSEASMRKQNILIPLFILD